MLTKTYQVYAANQLTLSTGSIRFNLLRVEGYCFGTGNTQYFVQIHNNAIASLTSASVPALSLQALGADGFTFNYMPQGLDLWTATGVLSTMVATWCCVLSTTDGVYTAPTDGATFDINVTVEGYEIGVEGMTKVTSGAGTTFTILADAANQTSKLYSLSFSSAGLTNPCYLMLFAAPPIAGSVPIIPPLQVPMGALFPVNGWQFGVGGQSFYQQDANGTGHYGIYAAVSSTPGTYDGLANAASSWVAFYK